ncbi:hypothetical protein J6590_028533 [Homalodisca vitripennis]|nr:hypothetical protein J6590_028533 [Homalodisca vitripennis]
MRDTEEDILQKTKDVISTKVRFGLKYVSLQLADSLTAMIITLLRNRNERYRGRSFVSRRVKEDWLRAARTKKNLNAADIHPSLTRSNVYVNDHLTPHNKALLGKARRLKREGKIVLAGFFNGKVVIKAAEGAEAVRVTMMEDLDRVLVEGGEEGWTIDGFDFVLTDKQRNKADGVVVYYNNRLSVAASQISIGDTYGIKLYFNFCHKTFCLVALYRTFDCDIQLFLDSLEHYLDSLNKDEIIILAGDFNFD